MILDSLSGDQVIHTARPQIVRLLEGVLHVRGVERSRVETPLTGQRLPAATMHMVLRGLEIWCSRKRPVFPYYFLLLPSFFGVSFRILNWHI